MLLPYQLCISKEHTNILQKYIPSYITAFFHMEMSKQEKKGDMCSLGAKQHFMTKSWEQKCNMTYLQEVHCVCSNIFPLVVSVCVMMFLSHSMDFSFAFLHENSSYEAKEDVACVKEGLL